MRESPGQTVEKDTIFCINCVKKIYDANGVLKSIHRPDGSGEVYTKVVCEVSEFVEIPCRCKDCEFFKFINIGGLVGVCILDDDSQRSVELESYCSYGERRCEE